MGSIDRYIFRTTFGAFLLVLFSLTAVIWITQAVRDIDLITNQGQNVLVFMGITMMVIPLLILVIAPIALLIAVVHVLNKLSSDSEIIVMNASGMSPWVLFRAFLNVAIAVSVIVSLLSAYFAPKSLRFMRDWLTQVRANVVTNIVQPGRFTSLEAGVTVHIRERRTNGELLGVFIDDARDPKERLTILADNGDLLENKKGTFLVLQHGSVQRQEKGDANPNIVVFDRYAFDLSRFSSGPQTVKYSIRERYLPQLIWPAADDELYKAQPQQFRAELFDRLIAPAYPIAFVIIAFAYLGIPRTTRQSRTMSLLGAIGAVGLVRLVGFASTVFGATIPAFLPVQYVVCAVAIVGGLFVIHRGLVIEPPALMSSWLAAFMKRFLPTPAET